MILISLKTNKNPPQTALTMLVLIVVMLQATSLSAQQLPEQLRLYFAEVRQGHYPPIPKPLSISENSKTMVGALSAYLNDTLPEVRSKAYTIVQLAGKNARDFSVRQQAVSHLLAGCNDLDVGNRGTAIGYLKTFRKEDFTAAAKDSLRSLFNRKGPHINELIRLIGWLELKDMIEAIRPYTKPGNTQPIRWASLVSLTRMNDEAATTEMMRRVSKFPVNDNVVYELFPDLIYSRHPIAIAYMVDVLNSDAENCLSADAEREAPIPCGYRVMEQLAPIIEKYPLTLDESGDLKTKDYTTALQTVRAWFAKNAKTYVINRDLF
ncbi:hypothetical protein [Chryseolinea lacunae]|uniref:HEAT repeat domain-containing protein n=1 Tax=Chryseolinea lacunae TaxID=2801331 RepID=A0ABS1KJM9_9BACT|nr:hypothetical protein [Chryseolinea lacunae]MBL0739666.1 hypothetical protein [Chryseolinea lacunae]